MERSIGGCCLVSHLSWAQLLCIVYVVLMVPVGRTVMPFSPEHILHITQHLRFYYSSFGSGFFRSSQKLIAAASDGLSLNQISF